MKGWKTVLFNVATIAVQVGGILPPKYSIYALAAGNLILRAFTDTPIFTGDK